MNNNKRFKFYTPVTVTIGVSEKMKHDFVFYQFVNDSIYLHFSGNFGEISEDDRKSNIFGILHKESVFSNYVDTEHDYRIWIITNQGHDITTILFPNEY